MSLCALVGCAYRSDSFHDIGHEFVGVHATLGCLDLSVHRRPDLQNGNSVVAYEFGNRCDRPTIVDLSSASVIGHARDGREHALVAFDPHREIRPLRIDGRAVGGEAIAYLRDSDLADVCVDAASIAHATPELWMCFRTEDK